MTQPIPNASVEPIDPRTGRFVGVWYNFFKFGSASAEAAGQPEYRLLGSSSIVVSGLLQNGLAQVSLAPLADSGSGELLAITRDTQGRVSGTRSAWPDVMARLSFRV